MKRVGMMEGAAMIAAMITLVAAGGCKRVDQAAPAAPAIEPVKAIYALPACAPAPDEIAGIANIVVPDGFAGNKIQRKVFIRKAKNPPSRDPRPQLPGSKPNKPGATGQPFDVFFDREAGFGSADKGYLLVQVMLPNGKKNEPHWVFHRGKGFEGVGLAGQEHAAVLCGGAAVEEVKASGPNPPEDEARQIATFFVRLEKFDWNTPGFAVPFVIGIQLPTYGENPFFIDPKVRNDGGGDGIRNAPTPPSGGG